MNREVMRAEADVVGPHTFLAPTAQLPRYLNYLHLTNDAELLLGEEFGQLEPPTQVVVGPSRSLEPRAVSSRCRSRTASWPS